MSYPLLSAAALASGLCVLVSLLRLRRVHRSTSGHPAELLERLRRGTAETVRSVAQTLPPGSAERQLLTAVDAPSRELGVAELNEHMADIGWRLDRGAPTPRAAARISLTSGTVLAVLGLARSLPAAGGPDVAGPLLSFALGAAGALAAAQIGRVAEARAERRRAGWNAVARLLAGLLPPAGGAAARENP